MTTTFAFHGLRRMSVLSLLVAVNAVMLLSCRADAQQNIKRIKMEKENLKEIYLAGGSFWGTEHYLKQIGILAISWHFTPFLQLLFNIIASYFNICLLSHKFRDLLGKWFISFCR